MYLGIILSYYYLSLVYYIVFYEIYPIIIRIIYYA